MGSDGASHGGRPRGDGGGSVGEVLDGPPSPAGVTTLDELCARLRDLRAWAGNPSFTRLVHDIAVIRAARGLPDGECRPGRVTVFECFRYGRRRLDVDLLLDVVTALGVDEPGRVRWRRAHRVASSPTAFPPEPPNGDCRSESQARAADALRAALRAASPGHVVNLTGPVGVGKSTVLDAVEDGATRVDLAVDGGDRALGAAMAAARGPVLVDNADSPAALSRLWRLLGAASPVVVVATRRGLAARLDTPTALLSRITAVPVGAWPDDEVDALAAWCGVVTPGGRAAVVHLAGGVPLLAERLCRAVHRGAPVDQPGPMADLAVAEVTRRLRRECAADPDVEAVVALAGYGQADQELVTGAEFSRLAEVSLVEAAAGGIAVVEPYRTLLDSVSRWRAPMAHRRAAARAVVHHRAVIAGSRDADERAQRAEQALWLTGDPTIRDALFPTRGEPTVVRTSSDADGEDVHRLLSRWARRGGLDVRSSERVLSPLLAGDPEGFRLAIGPDGDVVGAITALPLVPRTHHLVEPLMQRHAPEAASKGGIFVGMAFARDDQSQAALLRDVLLRGISAGQVVVATQWPAYQRLVNRLGFVHHGNTQDDVFRCGRRVQVHTLRLASADLAPWLGRLTASGIQLGDFGERAWLVEKTRWALSHWHSPTVLAASPLLASPLTPSVPALRAVLATAVEALAADPDPDRAAAGKALGDAYLARRAAVRHLRPPAVHTTSRRLQLGLGVVADALLRKDHGAP